MHQNTLKGVVLCSVKCQSVHSLVLLKVYMNKKV